MPFRVVKTKGADPVGMLAQLTGQAMTDESARQQLAVEVGVILDGRNDDVLFRTLDYVGHEEADLLESIIHQMTYQPDDILETTEGGGRPVRLESFALPLAIVAEPEAERFSYLPFLDCDELVRTLKQVLDVGSATVHFDMRLYSAESMLQVLPSEHRHYSRAAAEAFEDSIAMILPLMEEDIVVSPNGRVVPVLLIGWYASSDQKDSFPWESPEGKENRHNLQQVAEAVANEITGQMGLPGVWAMAMDTVMGVPTGAAYALKAARYMDLLAAIKGQCETNGPLRMPVVDLVCTNDADGILECAQLLLKEGEKVVLIHPLPYYPSIETDREFQKEVMMAVTKALGADGKGIPSGEVAPEREMGKLLFFPADGVGNA